MFFLPHPTLTCSSRLAAALDLDPSPAASQYASSAAAADAAVATAARASLRSRAPTALGLDATFFLAMCHLAPPRDSGEANKREGWECVCRWRLAGASTHGERRVFIFSVS